MRVQLAYRVDSTFIASCAFNWHDFFVVSDLNFVWLKKILWK